MQRRRVAVWFGVAFAVGSSVASAARADDSLLGLPEIVVRRADLFVAGGVSWRCTLTRCTTGLMAPRRDLIADCRALAAEVGRLRAFTHGRRSLTGKELVFCNASARAAPPPPPAAPSTADPNATIIRRADGTIAVRTRNRLTITGLGDRVIARPAPAAPVRVRVAAALTITGLGDRRIAPPAAAAPIAVRVSSILTITGVARPAPPAGTVTVRALDILIITGLGDRTIVPPAPAPPVSVRVPRRSRSPASASGRSCRPPARRP